MKIKDLPIESRPREKAKHHGIETLSDQELLALIIGSGVKGCSAIDIARNLLSTYPNLLTLAKANLNALENQFGLSSNRALNLLAAFEIYNRLISPQYQIDSYINDEKDVYLRYRYLEGYSQEVLAILMLNRNNKILKEKILYKGTESDISINPTEICAELIISKCKKYILIHNHPNGEKYPSEDDEYTTSTIIKAAENIHISFVDHIIIYPGGFYSFRHTKNK